MNTYANQAIVILLLELVVGAISSYFLAGETIGLKEWIGGAMIVSASLFSAKMCRSST
jgi:drug/metabolite transporter (DMT)-like permease